MTGPLIKDPNCRDELSEGWVVVAQLSEPIAGSKSYVGQVVRESSLALRIRAIDWFTGHFSGPDWWLPWGLIVAMQVWTEPDESGLWGHNLDIVQMRMNGASKEEIAEAIEQHKERRR